MKITSIAPDLPPSDPFFVLRPYKNTLVERKFFSDKEVIAETKVYFEAKRKLYYKNGREKLYDCYSHCVVFEGNYVENKNK